ncbi:MAG: HAD family hydrolase [Ignavibacteriaceae bacterium]|jgi:Cof subfamily protein (haloacid dehalogenase superfamily)
MTDVLKKIKIVVFDLDGTLLADNGTIGEDTRSLIKKLKEYDVRFTFATGRLHSAITYMAEDLGLKVPLVSLDGSLIKSYPEGKTLFESFVKKRHVKKALDYVKQYTLNIALCHADAIYYTEENYIITQLMEKFGARYEQVDSYDDYFDQTLEISIAGDNKNFMKYIWERMSFPYSFGLKSSYFKSHRHDNIYYVEIRKKNASKGSGMLRLLKYLKLKPNQAAVVGDWYNDISLFKTKAFKVALANAVPEIKRMADLITERSNNEDGTAEFLERLLKAKRG